nr:hypothetical protein BaRGS_026083 [Batillaria attramentaria]
MALQKNDRDDSRSLNTSRGVIRNEALAELGEAELIRALKSQAVTHAKVFKSGTIILTFGQPSAPETLWAGFYWVKVKAFIPLPLRCFKCQRFGHGQASCRNDPTCAKCGGKDHDDKDCSSSPSCVNCKGPHPSSSKDCPKWKEECTIQRIRVEQKVSFPEARRIASASSAASSTSHTSSTSYSAVVSAKPQGKEVACQTDAPPVPFTFQAKPPVIQSARQSKKVQASRTQSTAEVMVASPAAQGARPQSGTPGTVSIFSFLKESNLFYKI